MKKVMVVIMFLLVAGFVFTRSAMAIQCIPHQVKPGETVGSLSQYYTDSYVENLIIRKDSAGRTAYLSSQNQLLPGETVYIAKSKVATNTVSDSSALIASTFEKEEKTAEKELPGLEEKILVAQKPPNVPPQPEPPPPPTETAPAPEKISTQEEELGLKTDFKEGIEKWNASVGYTRQEDYDAGRKDKSDRSGESFYIKGHFFPWKLKTKKRIWKIGSEGKGYWGKSDVGKDTYNWIGGELGIRIESEKDYQTIGFNGGLGFQETSKEDSPKGQKSLMTYIGASWEDKQRRASGETLFPKHYASIRLNHMLDGDTEGGASEYDESTLDFRGKAGIFDWSPEESSLLFTPTLNALGGYSWGKESIFVGGGPGLEIGDTSGNTFIETRFWNPKIFLDSPGASTMEAFSIIINIDDTFRALRAEGVKEYKPGNEETKPVPKEEAEENWP